MSTKTAANMMTAMSDECDNARDNVEGDNEHKDYRPPVEGETSRHGAMAKSNDSDSKPNNHIQIQRV